MHKTSILFLLLILSFIYADKIITIHKLRKQVKNDPIKCNEQLGLTEDQVTRLVQTINITSLNPTHKHKCFVKCIIERANFAVNGTLDKEKFISVVTTYGQPEAALRKYFDNCKHYYREVKSCTPLWKMYKCFLGIIKYPE